MEFVLMCNEYRSWYDYYIWVPQQLVIYATEIGPII